MLASMFASACRDVPRWGRLALWLLGLQLRWVSGSLSVVRSGCGAGVGAAGCRCRHQLVRRCLLLGKMIAAPRRDIRRWGRLVL